MGNNGLLFVISGPSGVGKGTVIKQVLAQAQDLHLAISATTREPRSNEIDGQHYHFLNESNFNAYITNDAFLFFEHLGYQFQ